MSLVLWLDELWEFGSPPSVSSVVSGGPVRPVDQLESCGSRYGHCRRVRR